MPKKVKAPKKPYVAVAASTMPSASATQTVKAPRAMAALQISVEHKFASADLTVWVDDEPVLPRSSRETRRNLARSVMLKRNNRKVCT